MPFRHVLCGVHVREMRNVRVRACGALGNGILRIGELRSSYTGILYSLKKQVIIFIAVPPLPFPSRLLNISALLKVRNHLVEHIRGTHCLVKEVNFSTTNTASWLALILLVTSGILVDIERHSAENTSS